MLHSHAKINLFLKILGKRSDGFHELETVMQELELCDTIECEESDVFQIKIKGLETGDIPLEDNLIFKAYNLLKEYAGTNIPAQNISVKKIVPLGSGLGGGSSNAICVLLYWVKKYALKISETTLNEIAAKLGSDTNFFLYGKTALCSGRGELVMPLPSRKLFFNLIFPGFSCMTKNVFAKFRDSEVEESSIWLGNWGSGIAVLPKNDLLTPCVSAYPELKNIVAQANCEIFLSGSGSTLYTAHQSEEERDQVYNQLRKNLSHEQIKLIKTQTK